MEKEIEKQEREEIEDTICEKCGANWSKRETCNPSAHYGDK